MHNKIPLRSQLDVREELQAAASWYEFQHADLSVGLKSAEDALKLWRYWTSRDDLPDFCDEPADKIEADMFAKQFKKAIGYDPWRITAVRLTDNRRL